MNDFAIDDVANLLFQPGDFFEFGCKEESAGSRYISMAHEKYPKKPCCIVKNWVVWDLIVSDDTKKIFNDKSINPIILHAKFVLADETGRARFGDFRISTLLVELEEPCFFVTKNTVYILVGNGTRKFVDPEIVKSVYF